MALDVQIVSGATTYRLQAASATLVLERRPTQIGLPGVNPLFVDLGQFFPSWVIEGTVTETSLTDGGVTVPSKIQLEDFLLDTYASDITLTVSGDSYVGKIRLCRLTVDAAREDRWQYTINMLTRRRS